MSKTTSLPDRTFAFGPLEKWKLKAFKNLILVTDYKMCESKMEKNSTGYSFTLDIFVKFLDKVIFFLFFLHFHLLIWCPPIVLISAFSRNTYRTQLIMQLSFIVRLLPRIDGWLLRFGKWAHDNPGQKPKVDWSKAFKLGTSKITSPLCTRITEKFSFMRCPLCPILKFIFFHLRCYFVIHYISFPT